ncbi:MAG TPA: glycosyltransferase family protein [Anaerolineaceae bacterium]|jgi:spore coat polysaccharide biosynthesis protein SpsF|nr:glycosyltransferase family protein [Anaerolineaceae bacterium]
MKEPRVVAIIQARMGSNRLPGKVLRDIHGKPMLAWVVERARLAATLAEVVVATTTDAGDDILAQVCKEMGVTCFRGSTFDVLDRYYQAARESEADVIVRLTADCPLIDPTLIDLVVTRFFEEKVDFATNRLPPPYQRTYPIGLDVEVVSFSALEKAWKEALEVHEREHVMPYFYDAPGRFKILIVDHETNLGKYRWTVDTQPDLRFVQEVIARLPDKEHFSWLDVLKIVEEHPQLSEINAGIAHKTYLDVDGHATNTGENHA